MNNSNPKPIPTSQTFKPGEVNHFQVFNIIKSVLRTITIPDGVDQEDVNQELYLIIASDITRTLARGKKPSAKHIFSGARSYILRWLRHNTPVARLPHDDANYEKYDPASAPSPGKYIPNLNDLSTEQRIFIEHKFGLDDKPELTNSQIARRYKKTVEEVKCIIQAGLQKLRELGS
jgi:DNA-directed RNA polymerase specialized sigma24 family protein